MKNVDFTLVVPIPAILTRCRELCEENKYSFSSCQDVDEFAEKETTYSGCRVVLFSASHIPNAQMIAGSLQVIRHTSPGAYCVVSVDSKVAPNDIDFIKKSGANLILLEQEIFETSKLDFIVSQIIRSSYLPIKVTELIAGTQARCHLYHLMPLNRKFLPVIRAGDMIESEKLKPLASVAELYVKREDLAGWSTYTTENKDRSADGLASRCRAQYLTLNASFGDLVLLVSDQSEYTSYDAGRALYAKCEQLASDLILNLAALGNSWDIVNHTAIDSFGTIERGPAIACYSGLLALQLGLTNTNDVMIASLMADIGLLDLSPKIMRMVREAKFQEMHAEYRELYEQHPMVSLNKVLNRKLPIPENMKSIILCTHESADQKGFPKRPRSENVPVESYLIQFCELIDQASLITMGKARPDIKITRQEVFNKEYTSAKKFPMVLLERIRKALISPPQN